MTWREEPIPDLGAFSHFVTCFAGSVVLRDGTILIPCYGVRKKDQAESDIFKALSGSGLFVLRSEDRGETYRLIEIPGENCADRNLDEASLVCHPSGRVVGLFRSDAKGCHVHRSVSEDGGRSWGVPQRTGMRGHPLSAICLKSGNLLCAYARRWHPAGIRGTLSHDQGETWDVSHEKILRDDALPACFLGGPGVVQLDDESIFAFYSLPKLVTLKKGDIVDQEKMVLDRSFHQYVAGSRFTEDYLGPRGQIRA